MKHTIVRGLVVPFVLAAVFGGSPRAMADSGKTVGITAGPGRQYANTGGTTTVLVGNTGTVPTRVQATGLAYVDNKWVNVPLVIQPDHFRLRPHRQISVQVTTPSASNGACKVYGAAFEIVANPGAEIEVRGQAIAQLVVRGGGTTEATCIAALPQPVKAPAISIPTHEGINPWFWFLLLLVLIVTGVMLRRTFKEPVVKKGSSYGF